MALQLEDRTMNMFIINTMANAVFLFAFFTIYQKFRDPKVKYAHLDEGKSKKGKGKKRSEKEDIGQEDTGYQRKSKRKRKGRR